jgi:hypothetical protein
LRDTSILTLPARFVDVQVTLCVLPTTQVSPPFGEIAVRLGVGIAKPAALEPAIAVVATTDTLTIALAVPGPVTVQALVPLFGVAGTMVLQVAPPLRDSSIFIVVLAGRLTEVQVIV